MHARHTNDRDHDTTIDSAFNSLHIPPRLKQVAVAAKGNLPRLSVFLLLLLMLPAAVQAQFIYTTNDGTLTITGYTGPGGTVTIPDVIDGLPVISIGEWAFYNQFSVTNITIPDSITSIRDSALFNCINLTSVIISSSVTSIGNDAFVACRSLANITLPDSVNNIGNWAFHDCWGLTGVYFQGDAPSIGSSVFEGDTNATVFYLPGTTGWEQTFGGRPAMLLSPFNCTTNGGEITITGYTGPGGVVAIPITINGLPVTSIGNDAFNANTTLTSVTIPNSVLIIGIEAFADCRSLASVTIPDSLTTIKDRAFARCASLTNVTIPGSVINVGDRAFYSCVRLAAINVASLNSFYSGVEGVMFNKDQTALIQYPSGKTSSDYTIPNGVTKIGKESFSNSRSLTRVTIPDSVTGIGESAFSYCFNLTDLTIPVSVTNIGIYSFHSCTSLSNVILPDRLTDIGAETFSGCTSLAEITIPSSVTNIGRFAFAECTHLWTVTIPSNVKNIDWSAFYESYELTGVYFLGDAPSIGSSVFEGDTNATIFYLPGATGWEPTFGGRPTMLWNPQMQTSDASFGVRTNQFGFTITGTSNLVIVVEACTNLVNPAWSLVGTNTLTGGSSYFSDPQWTNHPARFYRLRSP